MSWWSILSVTPVKHRYSSLIWPRSVINSSMIAYLPLHNNCLSNWWFWPQSFQWLVVKNKQLKLRTSKDWVKKWKRLRVSSFILLSQNICTTAATVTICGQLWVNLINGCFRLTRVSLIGSKQLKDFSTEFVDFTSEKIVRALSQDLLNSYKRTNLDYSMM